MSLLYSLRSLASDLREGTLTPGDAVARSITSVAETEETIRAWVHVDGEGARAQARALEQGNEPKGPLWGVPVAVKDLIDVRGLPTRCGSSIRGQVPAEEDAGCVRLLRDAGAVVLGKTVTTEFGYFSPGPTRNPANPAHTPGGSSSGSAAAVAAGVVPLALGTQTAGSLTRPASYCGVAGFVAARGQFPMTGITGLSRSLDSLGLLTRSVADMRYAWSALRGHRASTSTATLESADVLLWDGSGLGELSPEMANALSNAHSLLGTGHGIRFTEWTDHGLVRELSAHHATVMAAEAATERVSELALPETLSQPFLDLLVAGRGVPDMRYRAALEGINAARRTFLALLERFDAVLGPAALGPAPAGLETTGNPVLSRPWQAMGMPVLTIPGLSNSHGLPLGLQLIGLPGREAALFDIGERIEGALRASTKCNAAAS